MASDFASENRSRFVLLMMCLAWRHSWLVATSRGQHRRIIPCSRDKNCQLVRSRAQNSRSCHQQPAELEVRHTAEGGWAWTWLGSHTLSSSLPSAAGREGYQGRPCPDGHCSRRWVGWSALAGYTQVHAGQEMYWAAG